MTPTDVQAWMISAVEEKKFAIIEAAQHDVLMLQESMEKVKFLSPAADVAAAAAEN